MATLFTAIVDVSQQVAATSGRKAKIDLLATLLAQLTPDEIEIAASYLCGELPQGKIGLGWATIRDLRKNAAPAAEATLGLIEVHHTFDAVAKISGAGSAAERKRQLGALWAKATSGEGDFLARLVIGELRQGALEGVLIEAIARAAKVPLAELRRAVMLAGEIPEVARAALVEGAAGLGRFRLHVLSPIQPMLAETAEDVAAALSSLDAAAFEWKVDGARVQVHKAGEDVRVFTRNLNEVTAAVPEIVEAMRRLPASSIILDGETIALGEGGAPLPFQVTMRRFGRTLDIESARATLPLSAFFFDILHLDGEDLLDRPARERAEALTAALPEALRVPRIESPSAAEAEAFFASALARGHEGVMAKSLSAPYEAGRRGAAWLKVKRARTLDLVILAVEWGSGRRRGLLSNLHLGARDPKTGGFVMLGKTFKGMTDEMLAFQTERLLALEIGREGHIVHVKPELVVEVAFDGLQESPQYPGGVALRFARVKRYRPDKPASAAATMDELLAIPRG